LASLRHPSKFQRVSRLGFVTAATSLNGGQPNFARCLAVSWTGTLYIHFPGLLPRNGILPRAKFTLRASLAFSYIGSVTAGNSSSGHQRKFTASFKEWNYGTFAEGATYIRLDCHQVGHRPTFYSCSIICIRSSASRGLYAPDPQPGFCSRTPVGTCRHQCPPTNPSFSNPRFASPVYGYAACCRRETRRARSRR